MRELVLDYVRNRMVEVSEEPMHSCCKRKIIDELLDLESLLKEGIKGDEPKESLSV